MHRRPPVRRLRLEDAPVPFTAVATDLLARRTVWFRRGPLTVAIPASIALPPAITPVALNGRLLADSGLTALPAQLARTTKVRPERGTGHPPVEDSDDVWTFGELSSGLPTSDVVSLSLETVQEILTRHRLATCPGRAYRDPGGTPAAPHELHRVNEMIEVGRAVAVQALDRSSLTS